MTAFPVLAFGDFYPDRFKTGDWPTNYRLFKTEAANGRHVIGGARWQCGGNGS